MRFDDVGVAVAMLVIITIMRMVPMVKMISNTLIFNEHFAHVQIHFVGNWFFPLTAIGMQHDLRLPNEAKRNPN